MCGTFPFRFRFTWAILLASFILTSCSINVYPEAHNTVSRKSEVLMRFQKIDNRVVISLKGKNNTLLYDSGNIHYNPDLETVINLSHLLKKGQHTLVFEVYNAPWPGGSAWEVKYDLIVDRRVWDMVHETSNGTTQKTGLVFTKEHNIRVK